jgi:hypothetical protein
VDSAADGLISPAASTAASAADELISPAASTAANEVEYSLYGIVHLMMLNGEGK